MAQERERIKRPPAKQETKETEPAKKTAETEKTEQQLKDELDELLASIDEALGENLECAQEYINSYVLEGRRIDVARTPRSAAKQLSLVGGQ